MALVGALVSRFFFPVSFLFQCSSSLSRLLASGESHRLLRMTTESAHSLKGEKEDEHDSADAAGVCMHLPALPGALSSSVTPYSSRFLATGGLLIIMSGGS